jgi:hypothetical protein
MDQSGFDSMDNHKIRKLIWILTWVLVALLLVVAGLLILAETHTGI